MPSSKSPYDRPTGAPSPVVKEEHIEYGFIGTLQNLKYEYRADIRDRASLEKNFREKFEALNRVKLTDAEFARSRKPAPRSGWKACWTLPAARAHCC